MPRKTSLKDHVISYEHPDAEVRLEILEAMVTGEPLSSITKRFRVRLLDRVALVESLQDEDGSPEFLDRVEKAIAGVHNSTVQRNILLRDIELEQEGASRDAAKAAQSI